jgi:hypothetical protein
MTQRRSRVLGTRLSYSVSRLSKECDIGRSSIYEEIGAKRLVARKIGRRTIIRRSDAIRWLRSLPVLGQDDRPAAQQGLDGPEHQGG